MKKFVQLFILLPALWISMGLPHEYHVSLTDIRFNKDSSRLEISMNLFIDDFEKAMHLAGKKVRIGDDINNEKLRNAISSYLNKHFQIQVNKKELELTYLGAEWEDDLHSFYAYMECPLELPINEISLFNDVFIEVSEKQENMHYLHIGGNQESVLLNAQKKKMVISLNDHQ